MKKPINPVIQTAMKTKGEQFMLENPSYMEHSDALLDKVRVILKPETALVTYEERQRHHDLREKYYNAGIALRVADPEHYDIEAAIDDLIGKNYKLTEALTEAESMLVYLGYEKCTGVNCKCGGYHKQPTALS